VWVTEVLVAAAYRELIFPIVPLVSGEEYV